MCEENEENEGSREGRKRNEVEAFVASWHALQSDIAFASCNRAFALHLHAFHTADSAVKFQGIS